MRYVRASKNPGCVSFNDLVVGDWFRYFAGDVPLLKVSDQQYFNAEMCRMHALPVDMRHEKQYLPIDGEMKWEDGA